MEPQNWRNATKEEMLAIAEEHGVEECDACGFKDPVGGLTPYQFSWYHENHNRQFGMYCEICASTFVSTVCERTTYDPGTDTLLYKTIAGIGNMLRKDIAAMKQTN